MVEGPPPVPTEGATIPILPLRNSVLFPMSVVPINVGRPRSVRLIEEALGLDRATIGILTQKSPDVEEPTFRDLHKVGTLVRVVQVIRVGPSIYTVKLSGVGRFRVTAGVSIEPYMRARIQRFPEPLVRDMEVDALGSALREGAKELVLLNPALPKEVAGILENVRDPGALADLLASSFPNDVASIDDKQRVLEAFDVKDRVKLVIEMISRQLEVLKVKREITDMQQEMGQSERETILRQQMKHIREQLGESGEDEETEELRDKLRKAGLPPEVDKVAKKQLSRMMSMHPQSAEWNIARTYLDWLSDLPWSKTTPDKFDVKEIKKALDEDHHGLEDVKKRIVEYAAVRQLRADKKGPILLFLGPPGVGKTSLGQSIARAMGRRYGRIALGGVSDEAEVRGHRRTYVGALPGRVIQALKRVGTRNPVLVLDEVDKLGVDMRGDPAAALLEVLDPEQNNSFVDHYLDVPFDLSQITFLATANNRETIPGALMDRMELIEVPGYTRTDKLKIAKHFLVPKQLREHGLTLEQLDFADDGIQLVIDSYTREAGVRNLEREIASICRWTAVKMAEGASPTPLVDKDKVEQVLGAHKYDSEVAERKGEPGVATGLAWTPAGGVILFVEASKMPGRGEIILTGNIRSVMQESAMAAVSFVRSKAELLMLDPLWLKTIDLHLHVPKGATAKDGPSAGVTMFTAVASLLLNCPVRPDVAMTGEISLRGMVLPVGGIKEKVLAAHRAGIRIVLLPSRNAADLEDIPQEVRDDLDIRLIERMDQILPIVLEPPLTPPPVEPGDDDAEMDEPVAGSAG
ncbi:MAG: endopeptidase La [Deltaproteobacteria bacterium]|nr:endopeptidase La [Deltaproteobacteria bacterium]